MRASRARQVFSLAIVVSVCIVFCGSPLFAWNPPEDEDPFRFLVPEGTEYTKPYGAIYGFPVFRLWGWSEKGAAAYSIQRSVEGRGGVEIFYCVQDMVTDKILWSEVDDTFLWEEEVDETDTEKVALLSYERKQEEIERALEQYAIRPEKTACASFPLERDGKRYSPVLSVEQEKEPTFLDAVRSYTLSMKKEGGKTKKLTRVEDVQCLEVHVCGYFASPFDNKIAVVVAEEQFVFEGREIFYSLTGCDLEKGF